ncbi:MAG: glucose 1-dehydrogenase [Candidatus Hydrogenedentes bacterium]|nr:glucose 1-dehydrogenase [Candidatus Hydrogenedentota bacterium]
MRLENKVAVITGAGMGMGREASLVFAAEGARIIACDINEAAMNETVSLIEKAGGEAISVLCDVSKEKDVKNALALGVEKFGKLDILYANAGSLQKKIDRSVIDTTEESWDLIQAINLKGAFFLTKHGIPVLRENGGGSIILIGSISALAGFELAQDSYTCAKGALIALNKSLAVQFGPDNIRSNIIHPGMIDTPLQAPYLNNDDKQSIAGCIPIRRIGVARDIVNAALFFASDESSFCNGSELVVDGGFYVT